MTQKISVYPEYDGFLPVLKEEIPENGIDFIMITPEAYVDHPSFGHALVARLVESYGYSVAVMYNPTSKADYTRFGKPNYGFLISGGAVDSMVNNYTVAKNRRKTDVYAPGGALERPDRAVTVYSVNAKKYYPDVPVIIGGVEASLRRLAHYDYWKNTVMPSILCDSGADLLIYGMGERPIKEICKKLDRGIPLASIKDVCGTAYLSGFDELPHPVKTLVDEKRFDKIAMLPSFEAVSTDKKQYAMAYRTQERNTDHVQGKMLLQKQNDGRYVVVNTPQAPLNEAEMDEVYALPFTRRVHPYFEKRGKVASIEEVKFSISTHRGCYGGCSFCALTYHQGRIIQTRSEQSIIDEAVKITEMPDFKGYIHDVGGPTANFHRPACKKQFEHGVCPDRQCIGADPCKNLVVDHSEYLELLRKLRKLPRVKKVFIRSGIRFDYLMYDSDKSFFKELVAHHISGQLKVAPEHVCDKVLRVMNKPSFDVYSRFTAEYKKLNVKEGKDQYIVPYLISSHPGCDLEGAIELTMYLKSIGYMPEQVQDFYPTPSTKSTTMYYTGYDPDTMQKVYVATDEKEKAMQRALLQYRLPQNREKILKALTLAGREDLVPYILGRSQPKNSNVKGNIGKLNNVKSNKVEQSMRKLYPKGKK